MPIFAGTPTRMWTYNGTLPGADDPAPDRQAHARPLPEQPSRGRRQPLVPQPRQPLEPRERRPARRRSWCRPADRAPTTTPGSRRARTSAATMQWYHDHRDGVTARNVWMGLAGLYILDDPDDPQTLPSGQQDVPLAITRPLVRRQQPDLVHSSSRNGVTGDHALVNGLPQPYLDVADRKYRLRILNASNIRNYQLELSNGQPMTQIGTESGLLPAPVSRQSILLSPAERVDIVVDFNGLARPAGRAAQHARERCALAAGAVPREQPRDRHEQRARHPAPAGEHRHADRHAHLRLLPQRRPVEDQRPAVRPEPRRRAARARHDRAVDPAQQRRLGPHGPHPRRRPAADHAATASRRPPTS